jgi:cysteine-rich repeat protein
MKTILLLVSAIAIAGTGNAALAAKVALFADGAYVDVVDDDGDGGFAEAEVLNLQASLTQRGHTVRTFSGISSDDFATALIGQDVLLIPELEKGILEPALSDAAKAAIGSFVRGGGGLIVHTSDSRMLDVLEAVVGLDLVTAAPGSPTLQVAAAGTTFAGGPATLPSPSLTWAVAAPLPAGGRAIYADGSAVTVALFREEFGQVAFLGWDWYEAAPLGAADGGWLPVLDAAVRQTANRCGNGALDPGERCDDGNQAAGDCCSATCQFEAAGAACGDDGNSCTSDTCNGAGACIHGGPCDDGNSCTDDVCTSGVCSNPVRTGSCDDGNACTSGETCVGDVCTGAAVSCDDGNPCTADTCDAAGGCQHASLAAGSPCEDGDACGPDTCDAAGECVEVNKPACASTTARQRGAFGVTMQWAPAVATPGVDFCVGQVLLPSAGIEEPISKEVKDVVSLRTRRAVLKMKLTPRGRKALRSVPRGDEIPVVLNMTIHKAGASPSVIRLIQKLRRLR